MLRDPRSLYSTPGVRGFGDLGIIQDDKELQGMQICDTVRTAQGKYVSAPVFGWMHAKNKKIGGGKDVKSGFLALRFFHPPGHPDQLGVQGLWVTDTDEVITHQGGWLQTRFVTVPEGDGYWLNVFWLDWSHVPLFELIVSVDSSGGGGGGGGGDPDRLPLRGVLREQAYRPVFSVAGSGATTADIIALLCSKHRSLIAPIMPAPPSAPVAFSPAGAALTASHAPPATLPARCSTSARCRANRSRQSLSSSTTSR